MSFKIGDRVDYQLFEGDTPNGTPGTIESVTQNEHGTVYQVKWDDGLIDPDGYREDELIPLPSETSE